jgi:hypothetical protein
MMTGHERRSAAMRFAHWCLAILVGALAAVVTLCAGCKPG